MSRNKPATPGRGYQAAGSADTDDFINRALGGNSGGNRSYGTTGVNDDSLNAQRPLVNSAPVHIKQTFKSRAGRFVAGVLSPVFAAAGVLGLISVAGSFGFFQQLLPLAFWLPLAGCVLLIILAMSNFITVCSKACGAYVCSFVLALAITGLGVGGLAVAVMIEHGKLTSVVGEKWNSTASGDLSAMCSFETFFECNGWITPCPVVNVTEAPHTDAPNAETPTPSSSDVPHPPASDSPTGESPPTWPPSPPTVWPPPNPASGSGSGNTPSPKDDHKTTRAPETRKPDTSAPSWDTPAPDSGSGSLNPPPQLEDAHPDTPTPDRRHDTPSPGGSGSGSDTTTPAPGNSNSGAGTTTEAPKRHDTTTEAPSHHDDNSTTPAPTHDTTPAPPPPPPAVYVCPKCPGAEIYGTSCNVAFENNVKNHMPVIAAILVGVSLLGVANIVALLMSHFAVLELRRVD